MAEEATKKRLLIATSSTPEANSLRAAFTNLEEIALLPVAADCPAALERLSQERPDALLLDLILQNGDGLTVLDAVAALPPNARPDVFALTALTDERLLNTISACLLFCFIKPVAPERVALRVLQLLSTPGKGTPATAAASADRTLDAAISQAIRSIGIPAHLSGYYYLRDAIRIYARAEIPLKLRITAEVYPVIANFYGVTAMVVENAMRTAIEYAWTRGDLAAIHRYFGYTVNDKNGRPGNAEFVMLMAEHVRLLPALGVR